MEEMNVFQINDDDNDDNDDDTTESEIFIEHRWQNLKIHSSIYLLSL